MTSVAYFVFQGHSVFVPLKFLYPECMVLIEPHEQVYPLQCLLTSCPADSRCMERLAKRVHFWFDKVVPDGVHLYAYYKYRDRPQSIRAGLFDKDLNEPRTIVLNQSAFRKFMKEGITYQWTPPESYWSMTGSDIIIPADALIR